MHRQHLCALITWNDICLPGFYVQITFGDVDWKPEIWKWTGWNWRLLSERKNRYIPVCLILSFEQTEGFCYVAFACALEPSSHSSNLWQALQVVPSLFSPSFEWFALGWGRGLDVCSLLEVPGILYPLEMLKNCLLRLAESLLEGITEAGLLSWDLMRIPK